MMLRFRVPKGYGLEEGTLELCNYESEGITLPMGGRVTFRPYECRVYRFGKA